MEARLERGCGLDVHQATVVACLLVIRKSGKVQKQLRSFGTTTRELLELRDWLASEHCNHVAMESTGVYWKPIYAVLEGDDLEIVVANALHIKKVPGRKTDVKDAEWIADLLCHGLLRPSFVPPAPIRELRDLTRYRRKLVESRTAERNRLLKLLESANIKVASVATDVFGLSGQRMLDALIEGRRACRRWPISPSADCATKFHNWSSPWKASSRNTTASCCDCNAAAWKQWRAISPSSNSATSSSFNPMPRNSRSCEKSPASI
jgi:transposase